MAIKYQMRRSTGPDNDRSADQHLGSLPILAALIGLSFSPVTHAEFAMNFLGATSTSITQGGTTLNNQSPFTPMTNNEATGESVIDPSNGLRYWHYILGNPATGFAQEVYIQPTGGTTCTQNTICTASAGSTATAPNFNLLSSNSAQTGNGSANPNRVLIRQALGGTWNAGISTWTCDTAYCSEFIKGSYADKPKITQGINSADFSSTFILDMSAVALSNNSTDLTLTDKNTAATGASITNVQQVIDVATGNLISSFDMAHDAPSTFITGGKYTYSNGNGNGTGTCRPTATMSTSTAAMTSRRWTTLPSSTTAQAIPGRIPVAVRNGNEKTSRPVRPGSIGFLYSALLSVGTAAAPGTSASPAPAGPA